MKMARPSLVSIVVVLLAVDALAVVVPARASAANSLTVKYYREDATMVKTDLPEEGHDVTSGDVWAIRGKVVLKNTRLSHISVAGTQVVLTQTYAYEIEPPKESPGMADMSGKVIPVDFPLVDCVEYRSGDNHAELREETTYRGRIEVVKDFGLGFDQDGKDLVVSYRLAGQFQYYQAVDKLGGVTAQAMLGRHSIANVLLAVPSQSVVGQAVFRLEFRPPDGGAPHAATKRIHLATRIVSGEKTSQVKIVGVPWTEQK